MLSTHVLLGCSVTQTVEVTRIKILERRIIEKVEVTVEVTRLYRVTATPRPTVEPVSPEGDSPDVLVTPGTSTPAPSATAAVAPATAAPTRIQATKRGADLLAAARELEQPLLALVQALNSDPLPALAIVELYDTIGAAPSFSFPDDQPELQAFYVRYSQQVSGVREMGGDLYNRLSAAESGEVAASAVQSIVLAVAQDSTSAATSDLQALIRELEDYLATLP